MQYRRDIDGLRAVAVLPVILFHAGFEWFGGGFIGVDVFFVISGYLITTVIVRERENDIFSLTGFYERRARRILPALFLVMFCSLPFAWFWMIPVQFKDFSQSLVAVSLFGSNFLFWFKSSYFAAGAIELKPLLHTWSLAVEEQFYVVFPVLILLLWGLGRRSMVAAVAIAAMLSLLLSEWAWRNYPDANFYLAPTRAWELLAGSLCGFYLTRNPQKQSEFLSILGLVLIAYAALTFTKSTPTPSVYALIPVIGTVLIILFSTPQTIAARILSTGPFVGIGLISYSAYLWHQPIFAFARLRSMADPSPGLMLALSGASLVLAYFSWRFVERPFRQRRRNGDETHRIPARALVSAVTLSMGLFITAGYFGHVAEGVESRFSQDVLHILKTAQDKNPLRDSCNFNGSRIPAFPVPDCQSDPRKPSQLLLVGDSHADAISHALRQSMDAANLNSMAVTYEGCIPVVGLKRRDLGPSHRCDAFNRRVLEYLSSSPEKYVVLLGRWTIYLEGEGFDNGEGGAQTDRTGVDVTDPDQLPNNSDRKSRVAKKYDEGIRRYLALGKTVILIYPVPEAGWNVPQYVAKSRIQGVDGPHLSTSFDRFKQRNARTIAALDRISHPNLYRVRPHEILCDTFVDNRCAISKGDTALYYDDDHLSNTGAALIVAEVRRTIGFIAPEQ